MVQGTGGRSKQAVLTLGLSADGEREVKVEVLEIRIAELAATETGETMPVSAAEQ